VHSFSASWGDGNTEESKSVIVGEFFLKLPKPLDLIFTLLLNINGVGSFLYLLDDYMSSNS